MGNNNPDVSIELVTLYPSGRTYNVLSLAHIHYVDELLRFSEKNLLKLKGCGKGVVSEIKEILNSTGERLSENGLDSVELLRYISKPLPTCHYCFIAGNQGRAEKIEAYINRLAQEVEIARSKLRDLKSANSTGILICPNCQTELDNHPANRCMDAWVAEFVLGYKREKTPKDANGEFGGEDFLVPPGGISDDFRLPPKGHIHFAYMTPPVSSRWDDAWQLLKRMTMQIACAGSGGQPTGFYAGYASDCGLFNPDNPCAAFDAKDEKLAICRAAIKIEAERRRSL